MSLSKKTFDFVVVGGCPTGVLITYLLLQAGKKVVLVEEQNIGIETTGCYYALINTEVEDISLCGFHKEPAISGADVKPLMHEAVQLISSLIDKHKIDCSFTHVPDEKENSDARQKENNYIINAFKYVSALAKISEKLGAAVLENRRVLKIEKSAQANIIYTSKGKFSAHNIIYTPRASRVLRIEAKKFIPYKFYSVLAKIGVEREEASETGGKIDNLTQYVISRESKHSLLEISGADYRVVKGKKDEERFKMLTDYATGHFDVESFIIRWSSVYYLSANNCIYATNLDDDYVAAGYKYCNIASSTLAAIRLTNKILEKENSAL